LFAGAHMTVVWKSLLINVGKAQKVPGEHSQVVQLPANVNHPSVGNLSMALEADIAI